MSRHVLPTGTAVRGRDTWRMRESKGECGLASGIFQKHIALSEFTLEVVETRKGS